MRVFSLATILLTTLEFIEPDNLSGGIISSIQTFLNLVQSFPQGGTDLGSLATLDSVNRSQCYISQSYNFPCGNTRGNNYFSSPEDVRFVGPSDIDIVGGIGDYMMAGSAALANSTVETFNSAPEVSFAMGGLGSWRTFTTIPNLLKMFNPNIYGYSTGKFKDSDFNFGKTDSLSSDLPNQARKLVRQMKKDPKISINNSWKLVTVAAGQTDLCHMSCKKKRSVSEFVLNMRTALNILFSLPNIIINVISPIDPSTVQAVLQRPISCQLLVRQHCPCVAKAEAKPRSEFLKDVEAYRRGLAFLISSVRYAGRSNAVVVLQTGLEGLQIPYDQRLNFQLLPDLPKVSILPDISYLAPDCFHPSQKLHALMTRVIWNNLFERSNEKFQWRSVPSKLKCPTKDNPYFSNKASRSTEQDTHQEAKRRSGLVIERSSEQNQDMCSL